jgi:hypothetical protein
MHLTLDQVAELKSLLLLFQPTREELRDFLATEVGGRQLDHYAIGTDLPIIVSLLIGHATKDDPPFISELVDGVRRVFGHEQRVQDFIAAVTPNAPRENRVVAAPYYACFAESRPFVDREDLRPVLERLHAPKPAALKKPRILVVGGNPKTGKTYTKYLISHLGAQYGFEVRIIDLWSGDPTPASVATRIASQMKLSDIPEPGTEQLTRFLTIFFDRFVGQVAKSAWWIVLDGFEQISVSQELTEFIGQLAMKINDSLPNVRLVLLGYNAKLPGNVLRIVEQDATKEITRGELVKFFQQFYSEYGPSLDKQTLEPLIDAHADQLMARMAAVSPELRYETMELELTAMCDQIATT